MTTSTQQPTAVSAAAPATLDPERADLLEMLAKHRHFLRFTTRDLTDEQARQRTTASELTLAGLIKHVAHTEANWAEFMQRGADAFDFGNWSEEAWLAEWLLRSGETRGRGAFESIGTDSRTE